ncbi:MAG: phasin family protein [Flexistipes sinusarabici]|uniref:Phasin family protein n=1 Tax=Flexistipes sinusarabici TaxID=2352 RepID=A0A5D0MRI0_FLESI|nr:phasin family protein [Flexistipes sinusarabici]TYB34158.1 MAG: phasin family protein [Flexistipes sinusarabici]
MNEFARKFFLAGLGLAATTENKAKNAFNELIQKGENLQSKEAKFLKEMMDSTEKTADEFSDRFDDLKNDFIQKMGAVSKEEFEDLKSTVNKMKKQNDEHNENLEKLTEEIKKLKNEINKKTG